MALAERLRISPGVPLLLAAFVWLASPLLLGAILSAAVCPELGHWLVIRALGGRVTALRITCVGAEMRLSARCPLGYWQQICMIAWSFSSTSAALQLRCIAF